jgi:hypothetical protein
MSKVDECRKEIRSFTTEEDDEIFYESWKGLKISSTLHIDTRCGDSCNSITKD